MTFLKRSQDKSSSIGHFELMTMTHCPLPILDDDRSRFSKHYLLLCANPVMYLKYLKISVVSQVKVTSHEFGFIALLSPFYSILWGHLVCTGFINNKFFILLLLSKQLYMVNVNYHCNKIRYLNSNQDDVDCILSSRFN